MSGTTEPTAAKLSEAAQSKIIKSLSNEIKAIEQDLQALSKQIQPMNIDDRAECNRCALYCIENWRRIYSKCEEHKVKLLSYMHTGIPSVTEMASCCLYNDVMFNILGTATNLQPSLAFPKATLSYTADDPEHMMDTIEILASQVLSFWATLPENTPAKMEKFYLQMFHIWQQQIEFSKEGIEKWDYHQISVAIASLEKNTSRMSKLLLSSSIKFDSLPGKAIIDGLYHTTLTSREQFALFECTLSLLKGYHAAIIRIEVEGTKQYHIFSAKKTSDSDRAIAKERYHAAIAQTVSIKDKIRKTLQRTTHPIPTAYLAGFCYDLADSESDLERCSERLLTIHRLSLPDFVLKDENIEAITKHPSVTEAQEPSLLANLKVLSGISSATIRPPLMLAPKPKPAQPTPLTIQIPLNGGTSTKPPSNKRPASRSDTRPGSAARRGSANIFRPKANDRLSQLKKRRTQSKADPTTTT